MKPLLLKNGVVTLPGEKAGKSDILIENGKIVELSLGDVESAAAKVIDLSDTLLHAGFIDVHNHGAVGVDVNSATDEAIECNLEAMVLDDD